MKRTAGFVALMVVAGLAWLIWPRQREPVYQGKRLSEWLLPQPRRASREALERDAAVRNIGTNAVSFLLKWIQYEREPWKEALAGVSPRFELPYRRQELRRASREAFEILGWEGESAIPELVRLMKGNNETFAENALLSVEAMGSAGVPVLLDVVTNRHAYIRSEGFYPVFSGTAIREGRLHGSFGGAQQQDNKWVIPILIRSLKDKDPEVAATAARALEGIGSEAGVVRALTNVVYEAADANVRRGAVHSLGWMGADSIPAVPCLVRALSDSDGDVRDEATNALQHLSQQTMGMVKAP